MNTSANPSRIEPYKLLLRLITIHLYCILVILFIPISLLNSTRMVFVGNLLFQLLTIITLCLHPYTIKLHSTLKIFISISYPLLITLCIIFSDKEITNPYFLELLVYTNILLIGFIILNCLVTKLFKIEFLLSLKSLNLDEFDKVFRELLLYMLASYSFTIIVLLKSSPKMVDNYFNLLLGVDLFSFSTLTLKIEGEEIRIIPLFFSFCMTTYIISNISLQKLIMRLPFDNNSERQLSIEKSIFVCIIALSSIISIFISCIVYQLDLKVAVFLFPLVIIITSVYLKYSTGSNLSITLDKIFNYQNTIRILNRESLNPSENNNKFKIDDEKYILKGLASEYIELEKESTTEKIQMPYEQFLNSKDKITKIEEPNTSNSSDYNNNSDDSSNLNANQPPQLEQSEQSTLTNSILSANTSTNSHNRME